MGQALYRSHRPKKLSEVLGQEHITSTLDAALSSGRVSHAYLFTGPRGTGKTSIARILAHQINDLPYASDATHLDIIEIDAASNRRIDEIRELRDKVAIAPTSAKYKVYIIDEVHMLTKEAFNALLKTLEEPPAHVIFILATTDAHKLPETIISRTQRYSFKPVALPKVVAHLRSIANAENITIDDEALELLAAHGEGSFRDSISMLDQAGGSGEPVTKETVAALLGIPSAESITALVEQLGSGSSQAVSQSLSAQFEQGYRAAGIAASIARVIREQVIAGACVLDSEAAFTLLDALLEVPAAHDPERRLEIAVLRAATAPTGAVIVNASAPDPAPVVKPVIAAPPQAAPKAKAPEPAPKPKPVLSAADAALWPEVLNQLKQRYNTLYGVVRMADPEFTSDTLTLGFKFAFHQKRLSEPKNKKILADIIQTLSGKALRIECELNKDAKPAPAGPVAAAPDVSAINNIFGGGELI